MRPVRAPAVRAPARVDPPERAPLRERRGEEHGEGGFVELHGLPERRPVEPLVLVPVTVRALCRDEVAQDVARFVVAAEREEAAGALDEVPWPHEVVAAGRVVGVAPRDAQTRDHRPRVRLVDTQDHRGRAERSRDVVRETAGRRAALGAAMVPREPLGDLPVPGVLERLRERRQRERRGRLHRRSEAEREHGALRQFTHERHVARSGARVSPSHRAVRREVLPAVARADVSGAAAAECVALRVVRRGECQPVRSLLGPQQAAPAVMSDLRAVVVPRPAEVRRDQRVHPQRRVALEFHLHEQDVPLRVRRHAHREREARMPVDRVEDRHARVRAAQFAVRAPLHLDPESGAIGDDEPEVAHLRHVHARVVHLVHDPEPRREPHA